MQVRLENSHLRVQMDRTSCEFDLASPDPRITIHRWMSSAETILGTAIAFPVDRDSWCVLGAPTVLPADDVVRDAASVTKVDVVMDPKEFVQVLTAIRRVRAGGPLDAAPPELGEHRPAIFDLWPGDKVDLVSTLSLPGMILFGILLVPVVYLAKRDPRLAGIAFVLALAAGALMVELGGRARRKRQRQRRENILKVIVETNEVFLERSDSSRVVTRQRLVPGQIDKVLWELSERYIPTLRCPALRLPTPDGPLTVGAKIALWDSRILPTDATPYLGWPSAPLGKPPQYLISGTHWKEFVGRLVAAGFSAHP